MRILYAIQGTGNGHLARAEEIVPILFSYGKVDLFVSGSQADITLPFPIKYRSRGLSFYFGKNGGIDFIKTFKHNSSKRVLREINELPVDQYDLVINDFEAISAWACRKRKVPCIALSHQFAMLSNHIPKPKERDAVGEWFLKNYAPCKNGIGFHFDRYDKTIFPPVIRERIRTLKTSDNGHYLVYLPAFGDDKVVEFLKPFKGIRWKVFSKHCQKSYQAHGVMVQPVNNEQFSKSLAGARGVLCGAGFETPAEVLHLGKKLMVVPMKNQYEQHLNAAALREMGIPVIKKLNEKAQLKVGDWLETNDTPVVDFGNAAADAVASAFRMFSKELV
ncbi:MAG: glycosyltransferase family protein [Bacteroidota bacterium]